SSLQYLRRFPVEALKVDRSFVDGVGRDKEDEAIVAMIVSLARTLDLHVIAEGVETAAQLTRLAQLGCEFIQGFYIARPAPADVAWTPADARGDEAEMSAVQDRKSTRLNSSHRTISYAV